METPESVERYAERIKPLERLYNDVSLVNSYASLVMALHSYVTTELEGFVDDPNQVFQALYLQGHILDEKFYDSLGDDTRQAKEQLMLLPIRVIAPLFEQKLAPKEFAVWFDIAVHFVTSIGSNDAGHSSKCTVITGENFDYEHSINCPYRVIKDQVLSCVPKDVFDLDFDLALSTEPGNISERFLVKAWVLVRHGIMPNYEPMQHLQRINNMLTETSD